MTAADAVRSYKLLSQVERAFRSFKTLDLEVRPIYHHLERRVRAHIFLCLLAYYVQWHMLEAWRPLLFSDEDLEAKTTRDPVAPARRSEAAEHKALSRTLEDGSQVHSFRTLLKLLSGIVQEHLPHPGRRSRCAYLRGRHHAQPQAAERPRSPQDHPAVGRVPQSPRMYLVETTHDPARSIKELQLNLRSIPSRPVLSLGTDHREPCQPMTPSKPVPLKRA